MPKYLIQLLDPNVPHEQFCNGLNLNSKIAGLIVGGIRIVIDIDGHKLAVHDVHASAAAGDDRVLIPLVGLHEAAEFFAIADSAQESLFLSAETFHDLPAPRDDAHRRVLGIKLAGVNLARPEVRLRTSHHPIEIHRADVGGHDGADRREPRNARLAAILKASAAVAEDFNFEFEREILRFHVAINDVGIAARILLRGLADDGAVFHAPEFRIAVPALQAHAIEEGLVASVIVEIERVRLSEAHDEAVCAARYRGVGVGNLSLNRRNERAQQEEHDDGADDHERIVEERRGYGNNVIMKIVANRNQNDRILL